MGINNEESVNSPPVGGEFQFKGGIMKRAGLILILIITLTGTAFLAFSCGGGGGGGGGEALSGTWVTDCFPKNGAYEWGKYSFNGQTGEVVAVVEEFQTSDCSGTGDLQESETWTYSTGREIECDHGGDGKCTELDMTFEISPDSSSIKMIKPRSILKKTSKM